MVRMSETLMYDFQELRENPDEEGGFMQLLAEVIAPPLASTANQSSRPTDSR